MQIICLVVVKSRKEARAANVLYNHAHAPEVGASIDVGVNPAYLQLATKRGGIYCSDLVSEAVLGSITLTFDEASEPMRHNDSPAACQPSTQCVISSGSQIAAQR
jgi:hypothetical protein